MDYVNNFFVSGGFLVWVLLLLSLVTISLIVQYFIQIRRVRFIPPGVEKHVRNLIREKNTDVACEYLQNKQGLLPETLLVGLTEAQQGSFAMENAMAEIIEQANTIWLRRLEWLNIIGNVAPMIGLFGTVWGMIDAFNAIVAAGGQPEAPALAGGISKALVTTWWGLLVAIPALAAYGILRNKLDALAAEVAVRTEGILQEIAE